MKTIALFPGRFEPWHIGHKTSYDHLVSKYGVDNVYITATNITEPNKSPFDFNEKKAMMILTGVPSNKILLVKQQYNLRAVSPLLSGFNMNIDKILFAVSNKDMLSDPRFNHFILKDGKPAYLQPLPSDFAKVQPAIKHGYLIVVPTKMFTVLGNTIKSASGLRLMFKKLNAQQRTQFITDLFGKFNQNILNIFNKKLGPVKLAEILDQILKEEDDKWYDYRILGLMPEVPDGHEFRSKVPDLENHPELWSDECPYSISRPQNVTVEPEGKMESLKEDDDEGKHSKDAQKSNVEASIKMVQSKQYTVKDSTDSAKKAKDTFLATKSSDGREKVDAAKAEMKKKQEKLKADKTSLSAAQKRVMAVKQGGSL